MSLTERELSVRIMSRISGGRERKGSQLDGCSEGERMGQRLKSNCGWPYAHFWRRKGRAGTSMGLATRYSLCGSQLWSSEK